MGAGIRGLLLMAALVLAGGCGGPPPAAGPPEILSFTYLHRGTAASQCYQYTAEQTEAGTRLYLEELFVGGRVTDQITREPILERLEHLTEEHGLLQWDGFDKAASLVLDGEGFTLHIDLADGRTVRAHGSNAFPEGYQEAAAAIDQLFRDLTNWK